MAAVEQDYKEYLADLQQTLAKADAASTVVAISEAQKSVVDAAIKAAAERVAGKVAQTRKASEDSLRRNMAAAFGGKK